MERSTYQVFDHVPIDFQDKTDFIRDFIDRLMEQLISYDDIFSGVTTACEKRNYPELCKLILNEIEFRYNKNKFNYSQI